MKSYTNIEQSKKLSEILPTESADACWTNHLFDSFLSYLRVESTPPQEYKRLLDRFIVKGYLIEPAWSLAALLDVMPSASLDSSDDHHYRLYCMERFTEWYDNAIDACYEMIFKLKENELI